MVDGPKFVANMQRVLRNKPPKRAAKQNKKKKSETVAMSSKKKTLSSEQEDQNQKQSEKSKGKEVKRENENDKGRKEEGGEEQRGRKKGKEKIKGEPIPVVESNFKIGVSRSDVRLFAHWVIGFLRHLNTEWVQIIFDIECVAEQANTNDYLLLSSCPSTPTLSNPYPSSPHGTEKFASVYATWNQLQRIRIRVQELPGISDQLILDHCVVLLEYFREKGVKEGSRWMWHPDEVKLLDRFLGCEICFWVGEEEAKDEEERAVGNTVNLQEGLGIECGVMGFQSIDEVLAEKISGLDAAKCSGETAKLEKSAARDRDPTVERDVSVDKDQFWAAGAVSQDGLSTNSDKVAKEIVTPRSNHTVDDGTAANSIIEEDAVVQKEKSLGGVAPVYLSFTEIRPTATSIAIAISERMAAEKRAIAKSPIVEMNEKVKDKDVKSNNSTKKLEVIWEEEDQPTELMIALRTVGMVEIGGFCYCWDRCALNNSLDPEIYEPAVAFPVRERMKIKRRNYQSEHSPDRFLLKERKLLGIRRT